MQAMLWNCCTPSPGGHEESIQEAHLDEYVGLHLAAPTLMQSRPATRRQDIIKFHDPAARPGQGGRPETSLTALLKLADLGNAGGGDDVDDDEARSPGGPELQAEPGAEAKVRAAMDKVGRELQSRHPLEPVGPEDGEDTGESSDDDSAPLAPRLGAPSPRSQGGDAADAAGEASDGAAAAGEASGAQDIARGGGAADAPEQPQPLHRELQEASRGLVLQESAVPDIARQEEAALKLWSEAREEREVAERVRAFLTEHGHRHVKAKTSQRTLSKTFPLHAAVAGADVEMVRLLLRQGADPSQRNHWHQSPLEYAMKRNERCGSLGPLIHLLRSADGLVSARSSTS